MVLNVEDCLRVKDLSLQAAVIELYSVLYNRKKEGSFGCAVSPILAGFFFQDSSEKSVKGLQVSHHLYLVFVGRYVDNTLICSHDQSVVPRVQNLIIVNNPKLNFTSQEAKTQFPVLR